MQRKEIKRGDLFYYDFGTREGSIQSGVRPVLVVQADDYNRNAPTIIVACLTAVIKKRYLPSHIIWRGFRSQKAVYGSLGTDTDGK